MKRSLVVAVLSWPLLACAGLPTLTESPEEYHLYRTARVAPTLEERLHAADSYLRDVPRGRRAARLRTWFVGAEEKYYLQAFDRLPNLYAYRAALPNGPHIQEVNSRIAALEARRTRRVARVSEEDARIAATEARLRAADADRRAFVATFKDWTARLLRIQSFGQPPSKLAEETLSALGSTDTAEACRGDRCRKLLPLRYEVPGERELVAREALLEVELELEQGLLRRARITGPELWTRLAEALALRSLPNATPEERADALHRASLLVRALLETQLPASECERPAAPPVVVLRECRGLSARMVAGGNPSEDDSLEIAPKAR